jgi:MoxR-like ATPase
MDETMNTGEINGRNGATGPSDEDISSIAELHAGISGKLAEFLVGTSDLTELILIALLSEGHILIEGLPGTAKTTLAKGIALITGCKFSRIQGAADIQPADMIGVQVYNQNTGEFTLRKGPIFTNILLTDELNRVHPKAQSAFIESMSERQTTIDGTTIALPRPFIVIATQNSFELEGTFPLIEAQRDRFMFSIGIGYMNADDELDIIRRAAGGHLSWNTFAAGIRPVTNPEKLLRSISLVSRVRTEEPVLRYIRDIVMATRHHPYIELGASARASIAFVQGAKGAAALSGRSYVIPDDVKKIARSVLMHRICLTSEADLEGMRPAGVVDSILDTLEVP